MNKGLLLTAASCAGTVATGYLTYKATRLADLKLDEEGALHEDWKYRFKKTYGYFIPALLGGGVTMASILLNQKVNTKAIAAVASGAAMSTDMLRRYENKTRELLGEDKLIDIQKAIAEDEIRGIRHAKVQSITTTTLYSASSETYEKGDHLFYDIYTRVWFRSSKEAVRMAEYHFNRNFVLGAGASLEDLYDFLGVELSKEDREKYRYLGWGDEYIDDGFFWIDFEHQEDVAENGEEFTVIAYSIAPDNLMVN